MAEEIRKRLINELIPSKKDIEKYLENESDEENAYDKVLNDIKKTIIDQNTWVGALHTLEQMMEKEGYPVNITIIAQFLSPYWEKYNNHQEAIEHAYEQMLKIAKESGYKPKKVKIYTHRTPEQERKLRYERKQRRKRLGL